MLYSASGNAWMNPQLITISFMPDGTSLGSGVVSNLQSTFNNNPGLAGRWEQTILQAAQTWAAETNINFTVIPDDGVAMGGGNYQEGDPGMGDIRIGGYNLGLTGQGQSIAWTYYPPSANNWSLSGDITLNDADSFNIGSTYDLFTVATHEIGHALGLGESTVPSSMMYATYNGKKTGLAADDIAGIQSIYGGARAYDIYGGLNSTFLTAANLDSQINTNTLTGLAYNLDLATIGQSEYFSVDVPAGVNGSMTVQVQSQGLSLLSPQVSVYTGGVLNLGILPTQIASASGLNQDGTTLDVTIPNAVAGQRYYIKVQGADSTVFSTGDYALGLSFNSAVAPPTEASPMVSYLAGTNHNAGGGSAQQGQSAPGLVGAPPDILGITPDTGASSSDGITDVNRIAILGVAPQGETVTVYLNGNVLGTTVAGSNGNWTFDNTGTALPDGNYSITATATDPDGNVSVPSPAFAMTIDTTPPSAPTITGVVGTFIQNGNGAVTGDSTPMFYGTAEPYSQVTLYNGSTALGTAAADPNGHWDLTLASGIMSTFSDLNFNATATDVAGNVSPLSASYTVAVLPSFLASSPGTITSFGVAAGSNLGVNADGSINTGTTTTFTGNATAGSQVAITEDGVVIGVAMANSDGAWSFTATGLTSQRHRITFETVNADGTLSGVVDTLYIDA